MAQPAKTFGAALNNVSSMHPLSTLMHDSMHACWWQTFWMCCYIAKL